MPTEHEEVNIKCHSQPTLLKLCDVSVRMKEECKPRPELIGSQNRMEPAEKERPSMTSSERKVVSNSLLNTIKPCLDNSNSTSFKYLYLDSRLFKTIHYMLM